MRNSPESRSRRRSRVCSTQTAPQRSRHAHSCFQAGCADGESAPSQHVWRASDGDAVQDGQLRTKGGTPAWLLCSPSGIPGHVLDACVCRPGHGKGLAGAATAEAVIIRLPPLIIGSAGEARCVPWCWGRGQQAGRQQQQSVMLRARNEPRWWAAGTTYYCCRHDDCWRTPHAALLLLHAALMPSSSCSSCSSSSLAPPPPPTTTSEKEARAINAKEPEEADDDDEDNSSSSDDDDDTTDDFDRRPPAAAAPGGGRC